MSMCVAGVHDISGPGTARRASDSDGRRVRTHCADADAWISPAERRRQRHQTYVSAISYRALPFSDPTSRLAYRTYFSLSVSVCLSVAIVLYMLQRRGIVL